jgi:hypothetical protein
MYVISLQGEAKAYQRGVTALSLIPLLLFALTKKLYSLS